VPTLLVKNVSEELLKELRRLKVELGCKTWAELLEVLVRQKPRETFVLDREEVEEIKRNVEEFLELRKIVSKRWIGPPSVLKEFREARDHEGG